MKHPLLINSNGKSIGFHSINKVLMWSGSAWVATQIKNIPGLLRQPE